jgi:pilus assembly protein Flp/PilA
MAGLGLTIGRFGADERGATAIEYGLIAALIGLALIVAFGSLNSSIQGLFNYVLNTAGAAVDNAFS